MSESKQEKIGAVLVIGGGIAGTQAALDLADSGFRVYLLERQTAIGGRMAQLDKTFPTNDCAMCILAPKLVDAGRHPNIELITNAEVMGVDGAAGNFQVTVKEHPRFVDEDKCVGCGLCAERCPVKVPNEFDMGMGERKAIYVPYPQAVPLKYAIDRDHCLYFKTGKCKLCEKVCPTHAINHEQRGKKTVLDVGSIIVAPGYEQFDPRVKSEYGYGVYPNVVTGLEFERMLNASGPTGGHVQRRSDDAVPKKIAFIQCVGSRDEKTNEYCSSVCCMFGIKEAIIAKEHTPGVEPHIFFIDIRAFGKEFDDYYTRAEEEYGIKFTRCRVPSVSPAVDNDVIVNYVEDGDPKEGRFELVVLCCGLCPPKDAIALSERLGIDLDKYNFCATSPFSPIETSRPGIFVCGAFSGPKDIPDSVAQASGAALKASSVIARERNKLVTAREYPPERDVSGEEPRIGVFVCHCGTNIGGVVDVLSVRDYAKALPGVVYAEDNLYSCSQDAQEHIAAEIKKHRLNRVVVAACTPRTHEPLFQETLRESGLNPYLFEFVNIRDQCSWAHMQEPERATEKSKDLIRMGVAKANLLEPLQRGQIEVTPSALVIGGGLSGITAALGIAEQGFDVHLVESDEELGGNLRKVQYLVSGEDPKKQVAKLIQKVEAEKRIKVYTNAELIGVKGSIGDFTTTLKDALGNQVEIKHGAVIVATGGVEYKPTEYLYGKDSHIVTQLELEGALAKGTINASTIVMINCVGSRDEERPYCSRICCTQAIKNALKIKERDPNAEVYVLYKDIRTYGSKEDYYKEATRKGVKFVLYDDDSKPAVDRKNGKLHVIFYDPILGEKFALSPDLLVLSAAILPPEGNEDLAKMLKVPLSKDGFFLEAHMKLRPVEFATDGIFLCGLAHSPKFVDESISQACAAASKACSILSKPFVEAEGIVAWVDEDLCHSCGTCVEICPYGAIELDDERIARVNEVLCKGCGTCSATCPRKAITMRNFTDEQLLRQIIAMKEAG